MRIITEDIKQQVNLYIEFLNSILPDNPKTISDYELLNWIPNCIECLHFALDNDQLLKDKPSLYNDTTSTLSLLYLWIVEGHEYAYIELSQKFKKICTPEEIGNAFKILSDRIKEANKEDETLRPDYVSFKDDNGNFKPIEQILKECHDIWDASKI